MLPLIYCHENTTVMMNFSFLHSHTGAKRAAFSKPMDSVSGLRFALDPASVPPSLRLSSSSLTVTYHGGDPPSPPPRDDGGGTVPSDPGLTLPEARADVVIGRGQYYWEVDVCNSSVYRIGKKPPRFARAGPTPALSLFAETYIISQHGRACLRRQSHVNMHVLAHRCKGHRTIADQQTSHRQRWEGCDVV